FEIRQGVFRSHPRKQDGELFSAHAVSLPATADPGQPRSNHAEHLVAGVVPVGVIEALEVVDVSNGNGVRSGKPSQGLVEGAAGGKGGQFVVIGERVGGLNDGTGENQRSGGEVGAADAAYASDVHSCKNRGQ